MANRLRLTGSLPTEPARRSFFDKHPLPKYDISNSVTQKFDMDLNSYQFLTSHLHQSSEIGLARPHTHYRRSCCSRLHPTNRHTTHCSRCQNEGLITNHSLALLLLSSSYLRYRYYYYNYLSFDYIFLNLQHSHNHLDMLVLSFLSILLVFRIILLFLFLFHIFDLDILKNYYALLDNILYQILSFLL